MPRRTAPGLLGTRRAPGDVLGPLAGRLGPRRGSSSRRGGVAERADSVLAGSPRSSATRSCRGPYRGTLPGVVGQSMTSGPPGSALRLLARVAGSGREHERPAGRGGGGPAARVTVYEVGPRDGLQNEKGHVPTAVKAEFVRRLVAAGLPIVETTSFVPRGVGAAAGRRRRGARGPGTRTRSGREPRPVLVPNEKGLERALEAGVQAIAMFGSATETFARNNLGRSVDESLEMFRPVVARAREAGLWVRGYVSMCFGDPWEGDVPVEQVVDVAVRLSDLGAGPALPRRHDRGRDDRPRAPVGRGARRARDRRRAPGRALPRHLRPGADQHAGGAARTA